MKRRHFIVLFLFLFISSGIVIFANSQSAKEFSDNMNKDKIKTIAKNIISEVGKKAEGSAAVVADKVKDISASAYEVIKKEGGELIKATVVEPSKVIAKNVVKKALSMASVSLLTAEDVEDILPSKNTCSCQ